MLDHDPSVAQLSPELVARQPRGPPGAKDDGDGQDGVPERGGQAVEMSERHQERRDDEERDAAALWHDQGGAQEQGDQVEGQDGEERQGGPRSEHGDAGPGGVS